MLHWLRHRVSKKRLLVEMLALHGELAGLRYQVQLLVENRQQEPPKPREKNPKRVEAGKRAWARRRETSKLNGIQLPLDGGF